MRCHRIAGQLSRPASQRYQSRPGTRPDCAGSRAGRVPDRGTPNCTFLLHSHKQEPFMNQMLETVIEQAWEARGELRPDAAPDQIRNAVDAAIDGLDQGTLRVAEKTAAGWQVNQWIKKA